MTLLERRDLRKTYQLGKRSAVEALRGVDVAIESGEMVAIMGPSGSGKSTLMHILGLLHAPDLATGTRPKLAFGGRDMIALGDSERTKIRAREMGFVFQGYNLIPILSALENVMLAGDYAGVPGKRGRQDSAEALDLVGLADRSGHRPSELRGVSSSASPSHAPWSLGRASCWPMSRLGTLTRNAPQRCSRSCAGWTSNGVRPSSW